MSATKKTRVARSPAREQPLDEALVARLTAAATRARKNAYAPYSNYRVGAAIATKSGTVYAGCNVENASFPNGICAERGAVAQMIAAGEREPVLCVIVTEGEHPAPPCGMCRQVLIEFARSMPVVLVGLPRGRGKPTLRVLELAELMPEAFILQEKGE